MKGEKCEIFAHTKAYYKENIITNARVSTHSRLYGFKRNENTINFDENICRFTHE